MSGVSTKISVMDEMTPAIEHMYRGVSQLISGLYKLNKTSSNAIDMSPFLEARKSMAEAVAVQKQLENGYAKVAESTRQAQSAQNLYNESIKEAEKIQNTFKWNRINGMEIFSDTGIERYRKELEDFNSLTERIKANQQAISSNVMNSLYNGIYPRADSGAFTDFNSISNRISELMQRMNSISAIDTSGFTTANQAVLNSEIETLRAYEREVLNVQASLSRNMSEGNVGGMNADVEKLNDLSEQLETRMRGILSTAQAMSTVSWDNLNNVEMFNSTGIERAEQETNALRTSLENVVNVQKTLTENATGMKLLPSNAVNDIANLNSRIMALQSSFADIEAQKDKLDGWNTNGIINYNSNIEQLRKVMTQIEGIQNDINRAIKDNDIDRVNIGYQRLNSLSEQLETRMRGVLSIAQQMSDVSWDNINNVEIFNSTGIERAEQEANALRVSLESVISTQRTMTENAMGMKLLPSNATSDITSLNSRIMSLRNALVNMDAQKNKLSKWDTGGINRYNSNAEQLRRAMTQIESVQNDINRAIADNDIDRVNMGYQRLSSLVNNVESSIRNNTNEQDRFNRSISTGANNALRLGDNLTSGIRRYITMAASAYSGKQIINASDTWTNNSSRLGLITDNLQEQYELQQQIYQSAKNARGVYNDTVDVTVKLGLLAGDAFGSNAELVKFTELMQKSFKLSGAGTQERQSAMYQLTQAMASGKLQGDEFRSIMENAPMLASAIAEYTGVSKGELKELSSDGVITADIIKNALFSAADDIESKFETMPMTFGDTWNSIASDATMAFAPVMESMNDMLNSDIAQGVIAEIPNLFEQAALKAQEMLSVIEGVAITAGPGLSNVASAVGDIATAIFSANGVAGTFLRTLGQMFSSPAMAKSIQTMGGSFITIANALSSVLQVATPLLPTITNLYIGFKMYDTISPILSNVATGIANVVSVVSSLQYVLNGAATAQEALNFAMESNPYLGVASAIAKVVAAMVALIGTIKAVNNAADLAENSSANATTEASKYAREHGVDLKTAQSIISSNDSYGQQRDDLKAERDRLKQEKDDIKSQIEAYESINQDYYDSTGNYNQNNVPDYIKTNLEAIEARNKELEEYDRKIQENSLALVDLDKAKRETEQSYLDMYEQQQNLKNGLNGISDNPNDYFKDFDGFDVDNVENVNHINDTVDIASEDLKFLRDLADQETINQFTSKLLQPQINVSFGEVRETADVDEIIKRITDGLAEDLNNSGDLLHI